MYIIVSIYIILFPIVSIYINKNILISQFPVPYVVSKLLLRLLEETKSTFIYLSVVVSYFHFFGYNIVVSQYFLSHFIFQDFIIRELIHMKI